ncbi:hypothetical protein PVAND_006788 [Polypedilum vanderplanki]|uniref:Indole-3-acetaldehyde oxidase n=1 Tax=Polypedilum vanderplanki TaxID=319348 RepID=A0A9J6C522_POLVA|nr:hypothetical protein PVAND_006788 [Polypedilum vanderplanki]
MEVSFSINGKIHKITPAAVPLDTSLTTYIRDYANLKGTKFMCLEGGCGACIVMLKGVHPVTKQNTSWAVNSCLQNIYSCHGLDIITVEGIGSKKDGMHKIQKRLADFNGTQCGFCTPGMVMNMFSLMEAKNGKVTMEEVENSFGGNICRCTGYRPILDAFKSLAIDADKNLLDACKDIEDLSDIKMCPKSGNPCSGKCSSLLNIEKNPMSFTFDDEREFHKVYNLEQLFKIMGTIKYRPYILIGGNTAHGVYRRSTDLKVFVDISSVEELKTYKVTENSLEVGGAVTLTEAMEIFTKVANENKNFQYLHEIVKHFDKIGNPALRNVATLAGNLMLKYNYLQFPSDIYMIMETIGAKLSLLSAPDDNLNPLNPSDFVNVSMRRKVIGKIIFPALDSEQSFFRSYKVMPRAQNSYSYTNASFLLKFNTNKDSVVDAKICYAGISEDLTHAERTEKFIKDKNIFVNEVLQQVFEKLSSEVHPDAKLPLAADDYRKNLAVSLFYKFILDIAPKNIIDTKYKTGSAVLKREISTASQEFEYIESRSKLYKKIPKVEGEVQCTGETQYINDLPKQHNELFAAFVLGDKVNGIIKNIDATEALQMSGVIAFFSAKDIPGINNFMPLCFDGFNYDVEEIFCSGKLLYHGQPVGIILAESFDLAYKARNFVKVEYSYEKEDEPIYPTIREVYKAKASDRLIDIPKYFIQAEKCGTDRKHKIKGHFEMASTQYHHYMETQQCVCIPSEDGMDIYSSSQWTDTAHVAVAEMLKVPQNTLNFFVRRIGGAFGGKISRHAQIACAAALGCYLTRKPVRLIMTMEDNMRAIGKRFSAISDYDVEFDDTGKIQKLHHHYIQDQGCSLNEPVQFNTSVFIKNCYNIESWDVTTQSALSHSASNTWMRAPGTTEAIAMTEHVMEHIARTLGKDPVDVRMANLTEDSVFKTMMPEFVSNVEYKQRKAEIDKFNSLNRWTKRGIAIVPMKYYIFCVGTMHGTVSIYHGDGTIALSTGGIEMGQGLNTKIIQVASHILNLPIDKFVIKPSNTLNNANDVGTVASVTSEISCFVIKNCCEMLLERLKPIKDENPDATWEKIVDIAFKKNIDLSVTFMYKEEDMVPYYVYGLSCAEVEVDFLTGNMLLKRVDILEDTGESMSPGIDIGQIEGGFVIGLGIWLTENLVYDQKTAELLTDRSFNYKPPGAQDIPVDFRIKLVQKSPNKFFVLRSKACSEPPVTMAVVVSFALRYAIDAARRDNGLKDSDWYTLEAPVSPDKIFLMANNKIQDYKLN